MCSATGWTVTAMVLWLAGMAAAAEASEPEAAGAVGPAPVQVQLDGSTYTITGPHAHGHLAVFLIHSAQRDDREFLTLNEALKSGQVIVTEKDSAEVSELIIENRSRLPLYLQEGDRLVGGKQDRQIYTSMVVRPRSGPVPVPAFCIEPARWQAGETGSLFASSGGEAVAPKSVRMAGKIDANQQEVWKQVAREREEMAKVPEYDLRSALANGSSSLNIAMDAPQVAAATEPLMQQLGDLLDEHPDAVGVAFAINGKVEEASIYPGYTLLTKVYPRLLRSFATEALASQENGEPPAITPQQLAELLQAPAQEQRRSQQINKDNRLIVHEGENAYECVTDYEGTTVHRQWLAK